MRAGRPDPAARRAAGDEHRAIARLCVAGGSLLLAAGCYLAVAYLPRYVGTPKLRLDQLGTWPVTVGGFAGLLALASLCHLAAWRLATRLRPTRGRVALVCAVAALASLLLLPTYPLLSDDLFYSIFGGRILARYGQNPFLLPPAHFAADPFLPYTGWQRLTTPYGPLWVLLSGGLSRLAGDGVLANIFAFKTLAALAFLVATALVALILRRLAPDRLLPGLVLWAWNPLILLESAASGHNDALLVALILLALALALRSRPIQAVLALTLAIALKYVAIVLLPLLVVFLLGRRGGQRGRARALIVAGLVGVVALVALFAPFWVGWQTLGFLGEARFYYGSPIAVARLLLEHWSPGGWPAASRDHLLQWGALLGYAAVYPLLLREAGRGGPGLVRACYVALTLTLCVWPFFMPWYALWPMALAAVLARGAGARQALAFGGAALATYLAQFGLRQASPHPVEFWSALAALLAFGTLLAAGWPWLWRAVSQGAGRGGRGGAARARRRPPRVWPQRGSGSRPGGRRAAVAALQNAAVLTLATLAALVPRWRSPRRRPPGRLLAVIVAIGVLIAIVGDTRRAPLPAIDPPSSTPPRVSGADHATPTSALPQPPRGAALVPLHPPTVSPAAAYATAGRTSQPASLPPNELGLVPILMYHTFVADSTSVWNRTPAAFRGDLEYLYAHGYYLTAMHQFVTGDLDIPAGKTPVILTFDDGAESQFRFLVHPDGTTSIDPDSAVGILEDMAARHPDFGRAGVFYVPPLLPFGDDDNKHDQRRFAGEKLAWLLARGYELGNHTLHHANLATATDGQIIQEIAGGADAPLETFALPFGAYPDHGDPALLRHCTYRGHTYGYRAVLLVGVEAAPSPFDRRRDLFFTPRIRATNAELGKWFGGYLDRYPAVRYVSDGDPATVTIPVTLTPALRDKFDPARLAGRRLVRYGP